MPGFKPKEMARLNKDLYRQTLDALLELPTDESLMLDYLEDQGVNTDGLSTDDFRSIDTAMEQVAEFIRHLNSKIN